MVIVGRSARKRGDHSLHEDFERHITSAHYFGGDERVVQLPGPGGQTFGNPGLGYTMTGAAARVVRRQGQDDAPEGDGAALALSPPGVLVTSPFPYMLKTGNGAAPVQSLVVGGNPPGTSGRGTRTLSAFERQLALERRTPVSSEAAQDVLSPTLARGGDAPVAFDLQRDFAFSPLPVGDGDAAVETPLVGKSGQTRCLFTGGSIVSPGEEDAVASSFERLTINRRRPLDPSSAHSPLEARRLDISTPPSANPTPRSASGSGSHGIRSRTSPVSGSSGSSQRPDPPGACSPVEQRLEQQRLDALRKMEQRLEDRIRLAQSEMEQQLSILKQQQGEQLDERTMRIVGEMDTDKRALEQDLAHVRNLALDAGARLNAQASALASADDRLNDLRVKQATHDLLFRQQVGLVDELQAVVGEHGTRLAGAEGRLEAAEGRLEAVEGDVEALKAEITRQLQVYRRQMQVGQVEMVKSKPELMAKACDLIKSLMDRFSDGGRRIIPFDLSHMTEIAGMLNAQVQSSKPFGKKSRQRTTLNKLELWDLYETKFSPDIERGPFHKADDMAIIQAWNEKKSAREIGATVLPASGRGARDLRQMDSRIEWLKANAEEKYGEKMLSKKKS